MSAMDEVARPSISRILSDAEALFAPDALALLAPGIPAPRVTLDQPAGNTLPLHVFVWGTPRDFGVEGALTSGTLIVTFHVWMSVVATASTPEAASEIANAYQAVALQLTMADTDLGGAAYELAAPAIKESASWADSDGTRHAGFLLDYEVAVIVSASPAAQDIVKAAHAAGKE